MTTTAEAGEAGEGADAEVTAEAETTMMTTTEVTVEAGVASGTMMMTGTTGHPGATSAEMMTGRTDLRDASETAAWTEDTVSCIV